MTLATSSRPPAAARIPRSYDYTFHQRRNYERLFSVILRAAPMSIPCPDFRRCGSKTDSLGTGLVRWDFWRSQSTTPRHWMYCRGQVDPAQEMTMQKPVAVCTVCGSFSFSPQLINQRCSERPDGKNRCKGVWGSALNEGDWQVCHDCGSSRNKGSSRCRPCQGSGWLFVRNR